MRVFSTINNNTYRNKPTKDNIFASSIKPKSTSLKRGVNFGARPWSLPYLEVKTPYEAMVLYDYFKVGNYLDSSDDDVSYENKSIRESNLGFLDCLKTKKSKSLFVDYYKNLTGFPNLEKVSKNIEREFIASISKSSMGLKGASCIVAGYDGTCSVGKRKAFPGSDLDKSFIILEGDFENPDNDKNIVETFKANLWNNTDQRILSYNHDISFPSIYSKKQVLDNITYIDNKIKDVSINNRKLLKLKNEEYVDLEKASEFNISISKKFPIESDNTKKMSKTDVKNFAYFIEALRDGKYLINPKTKSLEDIKNKVNGSKFCKYSNVAQMTSMKKAVSSGRENKNKILIRQDLDKNFEHWSVDRQYEFIKTLIKYSCEDNDKFPDYFKNDRNVKESYKPLLNILTMGDRNLYNRVEFVKNDKYLTMVYGKDKSVDLHKGYKDNVLWVNSNEPIAIKQVCRQINKIKQCELFKEVDTIQCIKPKSKIKGFYPIQHLTTSYETIYEKVVK